MPRRTNLAASLFTLLLLGGLTACDRDDDPDGALGEHAAGTEASVLATDGRLDFDLLSESFQDEVDEEWTPLGTTDGAEALALRPRDARMNRRALKRLFVSQFLSREELREFWREVGRPAWRYAMYADEHTGRDVVSVVPVVAPGGRGALAGYVFATTGSAESRYGLLDYVEIDYLRRVFGEASDTTGRASDPGRDSLSANGLTANELAYLWAIGTPYATAEYYLFDRIDTAALQYVALTNREGVAGILRGRTSRNCTTQRVYDPNCYAYEVPNDIEAEVLGFAQNRVDVEGRTDRWEDVNYCVITSCPNGNGDIPGWTPVGAPHSPDPPSGPGGSDDGIGGGGTGPARGGGLGTDLPTAPPPPDTDEENNTDDGWTTAKEVGRDLGLTDDEIECLGQHSTMANIISEAYNDYAGATSCSGKRGRYAIKDAAKAALASCPPDGRAAAGAISKALRDELGGTDWIARDASFKNNRNANCALQNMIGSTDGLLCNVFSTYVGGASDFDLFFYVGNTGTSSGITDLVTTGSGREAVAITIGSDFAAKASQVEITKVILHELLHADLTRLVKTKSPDQLRSSNPTMMYYYDNFGSEWQHEYMANSYRSSIEHSLKSQFGSRVTGWQLRVLVWNGLHRTDAFRKQSEVREADFVKVNEELRSVTYDCD